MVLQVSVKREHDVDEVDTDVYTVHVESHRMLTVVTSSESIATKWLKQALKNTTKTIVVVGVSAFTENPNWYVTPDKLIQEPYDTLCLSTGSHSLIFDLPEKPKRSLLAFFQNPRVFAVGKDMATVSRKLKGEYGIEIRNAVDVNKLAVKGMKREDLDLGRYDLYTLAKAVLGKHMDIGVPEDCDEVIWRPPRDLDGNDWYPRCDFLKSYTVFDPYLCFEIGFELIAAVDGGAAGGSGKKNKKKKSNK